jgi:hypothetical protein
MNLIYLLLFIITLTAGCRRDDSPDERKQLFERLHGKYKVISAVSSEAVDVNMDGIATNDIVTEIPELENCNLVIIISKHNFLLDHSWPQQFFGQNIEPADYDPSVVVFYVKQGVDRTFLPNANQTSLLVNADATSDPVRFPMPTSVTIEGPDTIKLVFTKRLYTSKGWKTTSITTVYKRYTMTT